MGVELTDKYIPNENIVKIIMNTTNYTASHFSKLRLQSEANELRAQCNNLKVVLRIRPPKNLEHESPAFNIKTNQIDENKENSPQKISSSKPEPYDLVQLTSVTQKRGILSTRHDEQEKVVNYRFNKIYSKKTGQREVFEEV